MIKERREVWLGVRGWEWGQESDLDGDGMQVLSCSSDRGGNLGSSSSVKIYPLLGAGGTVLWTVTRLYSAPGQPPPDIHAWDASLGARLALLSGPGTDPGPDRGPV